MKIRQFLYTVGLVLALIFTIHTTSQAQASSPLVYAFTLHGDINSNAWRNTQQAFLKAEAMQADVVLIKLNTFGGMVNFADSIRRIILDAPMKSIVYIDHNAASAGALISVACDRIYLSKGSSIGAASVVNQTGEVMPEKYQSYMRGLMRATAEAKGRDPKIAEAFVDPNVDLPRWKEKGQVLTFTSREAVEAGFADGEVKQVSEIYALEGISSPRIHTHQISWLDYVIGFLTNPAVQGALIVLIMGGIYFEMTSPGIGMPLLVAIVCAILYFAPLYIEGLADHWEILLFFAGIILLLLEIFVIPGFGIAGISGIILLICSFAFSMVPNDAFDFSMTAPNLLMRAFMLVVFSIVGAVVLSVLLGKSILKSRAFQRLVLADEQRSGSGYVSSVLSKELLGKEGIAKTDLRPSGKVEIEGQWYDAVSLDGYITKGTLVTVEKHENYNIFVRTKFSQQQI